MELADFTEFEAFNELREKMGTDKLGYFELFDPVVHLTGEERSELASDGRLLNLDAVKVLPDKTLAIKNSRVLIYNPDENWYRSRREYPTYHLAHCAVIEEIKKELPEQEFIATTRLADDYKLLKIRPSGDVNVVEHGFVVCKQCLHTLRYKDYDEYRNRRRGYSQKVLSEFSLTEFYQLYQQYPLSFRAKREA
jgi:hypothetical protein